MIRFSIVIPTYKRPASAIACLESLLELDYPQELLQVVLVEDGPGPEPLRDEDLERFLVPLQLELIRQANAGPAAARNRGAEAATGDFLAFTDDDCKPDPSWLRELARAFEHAPDAVLGGHTENALRENACSEASQALLDYIYEYYLRKGEPFFASNNVAISKENFARIGGFDRSFAGAGGEDREFCARCQEEGLEFVYLQAAVMHHYHGLSLKRFYRQHFNYGRGALVYHRSRAERGDQPVELEPTRFYTDLIRYPHRRGADRKLRFGSSLMVLSQVGNALGYFTERIAPLDRSGDSAAESTGEDEAAQAKFVAHQASGTGLANVLGIGCRYLAMLGATHILGDRLFGDYTLSIAVTGVFAIIAVLGLSPGVLPFLSRARLSGDDEEIRAVVRSALLPVVVFSALLTALVYASASWAGTAVFDKPDLHRFLAPMSGLIVVGATSSMLVTLLQGFLAVRERAWIERVVVTGAIAVGMAISWALGLHVMGAVGSTLAGAAVGLVAAIFALRRRAPGVLSLAKPAAPLRVGALLDYSWPLLGTSMLAFLLLWTDVLSMGILAESEEVGVYGVAARVATITMLAHESLGPIFLARLSDLFAADNWKGIQHLYRLTARWAMWPGLTLAWAFTIWGNEVLGIFGPEFRAGATVLGILCIGKAVASSTGMTGRVLGVTGKARLNLVNMVLLVGGNVVLNTLWIPRFGGVGAASATAFCMIFVRVLQIAQVKKLYGILPWTARSVIPLVGIAALALAASLFKAGFGGQWGWLLPLTAFILACGALFMLTGHGEDDRAVWRALRGRKATRT